MSTGAADQGSAFPDLNRCLTGYDLAHLREADQRFQPQQRAVRRRRARSVLMVEAKLECIADPQVTPVLVNIRYAGFMDAHCAMRGH
jgi:hypothetical protein